MIPRKRPDLTSCPLSRSDGSRELHCTPSTLHRHFRLFASLFTSSFGQLLPSASPCSHGLTGNQMRLLPSLAALIIGHNVLVPRSCASPALPRAKPRATTDGSSFPSDRLYALTKHRKCISVRPAGYWVGQCASRRDLDEPGVQLPHGSSPSFGSHAAGGR